LSLPGKTETKKDRALITGAIENLEIAEASLKALRKTENVRSRSSLAKQTKAVRKTLKRVQAEAAELLKSWTQDVENPTDVIVTRKRRS
jgi:hypothetical protein